MRGLQSVVVGPGSNSPIPKGNLFGRTPGAIGNTIYELANHVICACYRVHSASIVVAIIDGLIRVVSNTLQGAIQPVIVTQSKVAGEAIERMSFGGHTRKLVVAQRGL